MFKSILTNALSLANKANGLNYQAVRGIKNRGEYFRRYGYKYTDHFKGGYNYILFCVHYQNCLLECLSFY
jgi:hypothetical protein